MEISGRYPCKSLTPITARRRDEADDDELSAHSTHRDHFVQTIVITHSSPS